MAKKESAEEKLLKILESSKKAQGAGSGGASAPAAAKRSSHFVFDVKHLNSFLAVCVIASLLFLGYQVNAGMAMLNEDVNIVADDQGSQATPKTLSLPTRNIAYYLEQISARNIFKPYEKIEKNADVTTAQAAFQQKMSKYKLVGVAWLDTPESATVMLEDTSSRMTHFLREGEKIEDVTVKTIYTDRVVVSCANEEMVIKL